jgi:hypothetical protein
VRIERSSIRATYFTTGLHPQAGRQIAAEQMLAEMHQLAFEIDPHLAADGAPPMAEGVVQRQIAAGLRMHHRSDVLRRKI